MRREHPKSSRNLQAISTGFLEAYIYTGYQLTHFQLPLSSGYQRRDTNWKKKVANCLETATRPIRRPHNEMITSTTSVVSAPNDIGNWLEVPLTLPDPAHLIAFPGAVSSTPSGPEGVSCLGYLELERYPGDVDTDQDRIVWKERDKKRLEFYFIFFLNGLPGRRKLVFTDVFRFVAKGCFGWLCLTYKELSFGGFI